LGGVFFFFFFFKNPFQKKKKKKKMDVIKIYNNNKKKNSKRRVHIERCDVCFPRDLRKILVNKSLVFFNYFSTILLLVMLLRIILHSPRFYVSFPRILFALYYLLLLLYCDPHIIYVITYYIIIIAPQA